MHTKPTRRLFQMTHCEHLLRLRAFNDFLHEFPCSCFVRWVTEYFGCPQWLGLYAVSDLVFLERQADAPGQPDILTGPNQRCNVLGQPAILPRPLRPVVEERISPNTK